MIVDLLVEIMAAVLHLVGRRRPVGEPESGVERGPALHRVRDVHVFAREADRAEHLLQQFAGAPDERTAEPVFRFARTLADAHQRRARIAFAEDAVRTRRTDRAQPASIDDVRRGVEQLFARGPFGK